MYVVQNIGTEVQVMYTYLQAVLFSLSCQVYNFKIYYKSITIIKKEKFLTHTVYLMLIYKMPHNAISSKIMLNYICICVHRCWGRNMINLSS